MSVKRFREEIINDMLECKKRVLKKHKEIIEEDENYENYLVELENYEINENKEYILNNFKDDNIVILSWHTGCKINDSKKVYYIHISFMINYEYFLEFSVDKTNYYPNCNKFTLWKLDGPTINLLEIKSKNEIRSKDNIEIFDIVINLYNTFMVDPKDITFIYKPNELSFFCKYINSLSDACYNK